MYEVPFKDVSHGSISRAKAMIWNIIQGDTYLILGLRDLEIDFFCANVYVCCQVCVKYNIYINCQP